MPLMQHHAVMCIDLGQGKRNCRKPLWNRLLACTAAVPSLVDAFLYNFWFYTRDDIVDNALVH